MTAQAAIEPQKKLTNRPTEYHYYYMKHPGNQDDTSNHMATGHHSAEPWGVLYGTLGKLVTFDCVCESDCLFACHSVCLSV